MRRIVLLLVLLSGLTACAARPGSVPNDPSEMAVWGAKAMGAGCRHPNGKGEIVIHYIPTPGGLLANGMMRVMRKSTVFGPGGQEEAVIDRLSSPRQDSPVMLLSKINSHALDVAEGVIKHWKGPAFATLLCVYADNPRADHLRKLAQEKGFNLHVMPLTGYNG